jgi:hypothetical protein
MLIANYFKLESSATVGHGGHDLLDGVVWGMLHLQCGR